MPKRVIVGQNGMAEWELHDQAVSQCGEPIPEEKGLILNNGYVQRTSDEKVMIEKEHPLTGDVNTLTLNESEVSAIKFNLDYWKSDATREEYSEINRDLITDGIEDMLVKVEDNINHLDVEIEMELERLQTAEQGGRNTDYSKIASLKRQRHKYGQVELAMLQAKSALEG